MENTLRKKWEEKGFAFLNFDDETLSTVLNYFEEIEKWEEKARKIAQKSNGPFNERYCADLYAIASMGAREGSFNGKFKPAELYEEIGTTLKELHPRKKDYTIFDESEAISEIIKKHSKKQKKVSPKK